MKLSYSLDIIQQALKDFYTITNFRIAVFDENGREVLAHPSRLSDFCKILRADNQLNQFCRLCDFTLLARCKQSKAPLIERCHMGLIEIVVPIISSNAVIGYLMCGQIHTPYTSEVFQTDFVQTAIECKIDLAQLCAVQKDQPLTAEDTLPAIVHFLQMMASYFVASHSLAIHDDSFGYEIDQYITTHLTEKLTVETLCQQFHYQKTNFYKMTNELYGTGIMKHIRHLRIQQAKELLSSTNHNISEISAMVGIEDYNYFTKLFRQEANCTPTEYRRNNLSTTERT